jgi:hypothetical protein
LSKSSSLSSSQVLTTYTTVTTCPITYTRRHGSSVELSTSYTTSTITVTSCKEGCNHPHPTGKPTTSTKQPTGPVTVTDYITKFVPCSTPVTGNNGETLYYSTWLTATYIPTTYVTSYVAPAPTASSCPPAATVTTTVYATVTVNAGQPSGGAGVPVSHSQHHTKPSSAASSSSKPTTVKSSSSLSGTGTGSKPTGTGSGYQPPHGTGSWGPPPKSSSIKYNWPAPSAH